MLAFWPVSRDIYWSLKQTDESDGMIDRTAAPSVHHAAESNEQDTIGPESRIMLVSRLATG